MPARAREGNARGPRDPRFGATDANEALPGEPALVHVVNTIASACDGNALMGPSEVDSYETFNSPECHP